MLRIATRKSPLALAQTELVATHLRGRLGIETELLKIVTTGDQQARWSLEEKGGKGLFTSELEEAVLRGKADIAVHSTKDLPGDMRAGLEIAGYLPRADARDVLVMRKGVDAPVLVATGSPRRRLQLSAFHPNATFTEIRGNVDTRLRKIAQDRAADATLLAAAGLSRLGISSWEGLDFHFLDFERMVPAVGQAAIAIQCRAGERRRFEDIWDTATFQAVALERAFQAALGVGCHTAFAAHATRDRLFLFHEACGKQSFILSEEDFGDPSTTAQNIISILKLK
ncbi:MAG: hydroxymethylbilane synthase [Opitutaceae bacterium]|jgi:hydroxymethylbilane synthase